MSKSTTEQPIKKSKFTKTVELFESLELKDKIEAFEFCRELLETDLRKENAALSQKRTENEELLELIKKQ